MATSARHRGLILTLLSTVALGAVLLAWAQAPAAAPPATTQHELVGPKTWKVLRDIHRHFVSSSFFPASTALMRVDRTRNRIAMGAFENKEWSNLTLLAGPQQDPLSFRTRLLTNPEIQIIKGSQLTLDIINIDSMRPHSWYLTSQPPPYPEVPRVSMVGTGLLPAYNGKLYAAVHLVITPLKTGTYYYVSDVPGQARLGMYGRIVVLP